MSKKPKRSKAGYAGPFTVGGSQKGREFFIGDNFASSFAIATI